MGLLDSVVGGMLGGGQQQGGGALIDSVAGMLAPNRARLVRAALAPWSSSSSVVAWAMS